MSPVSGITASTRVFALIGKPVGHSLSPVMQAAAFNATGVDGCYVALEVSPENVEEALRGAFLLGFSGLNVTVPHKSAALKVAVEADATALATGAANTLVPCNGGWKAYNTDVAGFTGALERDFGFLPAGRTSVVLGAGGAARGAVYGLLEGGAARVWICARDRARGEALAAEFAREGASVGSASFDEASRLVGAGDLVVSATPLGLDPLGEWPFPLDWFDRGVLFYDMAYSRTETSLEASALKAGFRCAGGRTMLALQGARAFFLWTGVEPPLSAMLGALGA